MFNMKDALLNLVTSHMTLNLTVLCINDNKCNKSLSKNFTCR